MAVVTKMAPATKRFDTPSEPSRFDEGLGLVFFVISLVVLLSLVSFYPDDPSWSVSGARGSIHNWIGRVGALIADVLFQAFGLVAFLFPLLIGFVGWKTFRGQRIGFSLLQVGGWLFFFLSLAGLLSIFPEIPFFRTRIRPGGFLGFLCERGLELSLNKVGTAVVLVFAALLALMLTTSFSPRRVLMEFLHLDALGRTISRWRSLVSGWFSRSKPALPMAEERNNAPGLPSLARVSPPSGKQPEPVSAKAKKSWFRSAPKSPPLSEEEEKVLSEQAVSEALYADLRAEVRNASGPLRLEMVPGSSHNPQVESASDHATIDLFESVSKVSSGPLSGELQNEGIQIPPLEDRVSDTRRFAREAIARAQQRAQRLASGDLTPPEEVPEVTSEPLPVKSEPSKSAPKSDPMIEKMVESAMIVRRTHEEVKAENRDGKPKADRHTALPSVSVPNSPLRSSLAGTPLVQKSSGSQAMYQLPSVDMLQQPPPRQEQADVELRERARVLAEKCSEFNVMGQIQHINPGPVVTTFEFKPDPGVKFSRVANLVDDLCLALKAESIRIDRLPGKSTIGIEVPNAKREVIYLREVIESEKYQENPSHLIIGLGKTIEGGTYVSDLMKMPHLLIAGSTGSGKSVMVNTLICSILLKATPADVKLIMVDPKRLELGLYEGIPHLLTPIVTDPKRASNALKWAVTEMENRYKQLAGYGVRNIEQFNREVCGAADPSRFAQDEPPVKLPYLVIVIDELADLMMVASSDVETSITRLAQMARAVGIHLVVATQRPSVDVITGLIKANFPARISFRVSSKVDSRTILDTNGAEGLLGQGDMLFLPPGTSRLVRVHGSFVGEAEINRIVDHIKVQGQPQYDESILMSDAEAEAAESGVGERDELFDEALKIVAQMGRASTSVLQRRLRIGYGRAAAILDMMEREGLVGPSEGSKPRNVKQAAYDYVERLEGRALNGDDE